MPDRPIDVVRAIYDAWLANEPARHLIAKDLEYVNPPNAVEPGVRHDRKALVGVRDVYPDFRVEPERIEDLGNDDVLVIGTASGTSPSGVAARWQQGYIWTVKDGVAVRFRWFNDPDDALAAAGIED